ncbi:MAG: DUF4402 domain-containing protein [Bdellovibrionota bacterium]
MKVSLVSNLNFGMAPQGDPSKTVQPSTSETPDNASFEVGGAPNSAYTISLPKSHVVMSTHSAYAGSRTILVTDFSSFPPEGANGVTGPDGLQMLFVGATRAPLAFNQAPGSYSGVFVVTVIY